MPELFVIASLSVRYRSLYYTYERFNSLLHKDEAKNTHYHVVKASTAAEAVTARRGGRIPPNHVVSLVKTTCESPCV